MSHHGLRRAIPIIGAVLVMEQGPKNASIAGAPGGAIDGNACMCAPFLSLGRRHMATCRSVPKWKGILVGQSFLSLGQQFSSQNRCCDYFKHVDPWADNIS